MPLEGTIAELIVKL